MKFQQYAKGIFGLVAAASIAVPVDSFGYSASSKTQVSAVDATIVNRLFLDAAFTTVAPTNSVLYFVWDSAGNGVNTAPLSGADVDLFQADDVFLFQDVIDGTILGNGAGRYTQTFNSSRNSDVPATVTATGNIVVYLFNRQANPPVAPASFASTVRTQIPQVGDTFGIFSFASPGAPAIGDAQWNITGNINASQFTVGIPEPSTYALGGLGMLSLALYRRMKKR
jgi:hypothetical protein